MVGHQLANTALKVEVTTCNYALASKDIRSHPEIYVNPFR